MADRVETGDGTGGGIAVLPLAEGVRLDPVRLAALRRDLGEHGAEHVICRAIEGLCESLAEMETHLAAGQAQEFCRKGRSLARLAGEVGLNGLARVAGDVVALSRSGDPVAFAAVWARLLRLAGKTRMNHSAAQEGRL